MILVLASDADQHARQFALANQGENIKILSCRQIACAAMALYSSSRAGSFVSIDEELIPLEEIEGVINVLPFIIPEELFFFPEQEQAYQCEEFSALLHYFLASLPCPVINGPSRISRSGMHINRLYWLNLAYRLSIPTIEIEFDSSKDQFDISAASEQIKSVYFTTDCTDPCPSVPDQFTKALAIESNTDYLKAFYTGDPNGGWRLAEVRTVPDLREPGMNNKMISYLRKTRAR